MSRPYASVRTAATPCREAMDKNAETVGGLQRPMPADIRRTHVCGHVRFPQCGRPLRPVGKLGQNAEAVGGPSGQCLRTFEGARQHSSCYVALICALSVGRLYALSASIGQNAEALGDLHGPMPADP